MEPSLIIGLVIFVMIFIFRMPIALGMIAAGTFYFYFSDGNLTPVANFIMNTYYSNYVIISVPLFIFTANVMNSGRVTEMVFKFATNLSGGRRGALGHVNVLASLIFSGMTGSAVADASGLGKMEIEAMKKAGYDDGFSCAITAASATIGPIFPPSIPLVIYAMLSGTSIGALFLAGTIPAIMVCIGLMIYVSVISKKRNYPIEPKVSKKEFIKTTIVALPALLTPVILLLGIYTGLVTPTEAGAIAGLYAIVVSVVAYKAMSWNEISKILRTTVKDTGTVSLMIGAASVISYIVAREDIATNVGNFVLGITDNKYLFLLAINIILLLLGMIMDTSTIQLVFLPIVIPLASTLGINLIHFGLVVTLNMMIGLSTPPFGMLLFITAGISKTPLIKVVKEIFWPVIAMLIVLAVITFIPESVLFLPRLFKMI